MRIYNSAARCKERFRSVGDPVRLYACGPTVYAPAHLGHAKSYVAVDVLRRWLEYRGHAVRHTQNITDIADETAQAARREAIAEVELTARYETEFLVQMDALGNLRPHGLPRASEVAEEIGTLAARLLEEGSAYESEGGIWLSVEPGQHGALLGTEIGAAICESASAVNPGPKRGPFDFMLWGSPQPGGRSWSPSGISPGRPGWHLECTLMASRDPGLPLDIHFGGADLAYPHHESELLLANTLGMGEYCRTWMHNGLMEDADGKLSKSHGERLTLATVFEECPSAALRFYLLQYHYRDFTPFSETALKQACAEGEQLGWTAAEVLASDGEGDPHKDIQLVNAEHVTETLLARFEASMDDDLDTPQAMAALRELDTLAREWIDNGNEIGAVAALYRVFQRALGVFQWPA
ncbi:MAG: DALR domain-containing protein [Candidatus Thermoplasmatota archaeon]|nr:DALR domain-containing protein [Candidatus Thermoplasmatota archaeon]